MHQWYECCCGLEANDHWLSALFDGISCDSVVDFSMLRLQFAASGLYVTLLFLHLCFRTSQLLAAHS